jgi:hypothetical protein
VGRAIHRGNHRHGDVEQVRENLLPLAVDLVVAGRGEEIEAGRVDAVDEGFARAGQDHRAVVRVLADLMEQIHELLVGVPIEDERAPIRVQHHLQYAVGRAGELGVRKVVLVGFEFGHRRSPVAPDGVVPIACSKGKRDGRRVVERRGA